MPCRWNATDFFHRPPNCCATRPLCGGLSKVLDEAIATIKRQYVARTVVLEPLGSNAADLDAIRAVPGVENVDTSEDGYKIVLGDGVDPRQAIPRLAAAVPPARIELSRLTLEDVFLQRVSQEHEAAAVPEESAA